MRKNQSKTGYPCVYQTKNANTYFFESNIRCSSKKRYKETGFKTPEEAYKAKLNYEINALKSKEKRRLDYLINDYLEYKKSVIKLSSQYSLKILINRYLKKYKRYSIEYFATKENLDKFREMVMSLKLCTPWKNRILKITNEIYEYGVSLNVVTPKVYNLVKLKTNKIVQNYIELKDKEDKNKYWTISEWKRFLSVIKNKDWKLFFTLFGQLGCRLGEIRAIQNKHVSDNGIRIEQQAQSKCGIGKTVITTPKSFSSIRTVSISKKLLSILKEYIKDQDEDNFLFFNERFTIGAQTIRRRFDKYIAMAKLPRITIHGIRHSNCTWLLSEKLTPQEIGQVSKRLGHSSVKITLDIYMGIHKKEAVLITKKLDTLF